MLLRMAVIAGLIGLAGQEGIGGGDPTAASATAGTGSNCIGCVGTGGSPSTTPPHPMFELSVFATVSDGGCIAIPEFPPGAFVCVQDEPCEANIFYTWTAPPGQLLLVNDEEFVFSGQTGSGFTTRTQVLDCGDSSSGSISLGGNSASTNLECGDC